MKYELKDYLYSINQSKQSVIVDDAAEKARVSYDSATKVGAQCVIRSKS